MTLPPQLPIRLRRGTKTEVRTQFAALCFRGAGDDLELCLVTSRGTGRWILPKGWPMHNQTPAEAAATEAWEEAGLIGLAHDRCLGVYSYIKPIKRKRAPVVVMVYPLEVTDTRAVWPESKERARKWVKKDEAARMVQEAELKVILANFHPRALTQPPLTAHI